MSVDLFAGIAVGDFATSLTWYEKLLGAPQAFFPNDVEAAWEVAERDRPRRRPDRLRTGRGDRPL
jgi:hypothetical protein